MTDLSEINVLVLEDSEQSMRDLTHKLTKWVLKKCIYEATNVEEASTIVNSVALDLALIDLSMPKRNGMDFLVSLHEGEQTQKIPVIVTTAVNPESVLIPAVKELAMGILFKPVHSKLLLNLIRSSIVL